MELFRFYGETVPGIGLVLLTNSQSNGVNEIGTWPNCYDFG